MRGRSGDFALYLDSGIVTSVQDLFSVLCYAFFTYCCSTSNVYFNCFQASDLNDDITTVQAVVIVNTVLI